MSSADGSHCTGRKYEGGYSCSELSLFSFFFSFFGTYLLDPRTPFSASQAREGSSIGVYGMDHFYKTSKISNNIKKFQNDLNFSIDSAIFTARSSLFPSFSTFLIFLGRKICSSSTVVVVVSTVETFSSGEAIDEGPFNNPDSIFGFFVLPLSSRSGDLFPCVGLGDCSFFTEGFSSTASSADPVFLLFFATGLVSFGTLVTTSSVLSVGPFTVAPGLFGGKPISLGVSETTAVISGVCFGGEMEGILIGDIFWRGEIIDLFSVFFGEASPLSTTAVFFEGNPMDFITGGSVKSQPLVDGFFLFGESGDTVGGISLAGDFLRGLTGKPLSGGSGMQVSFVGDFGRGVSTGLG